MSVSPALIGLAQRLADASATIVRDYFRVKLTIEDKADASPVTIADRAAEQMMRQLITEVYPNHGIFGEELGTLHRDADYLWVLDPIDGTKSFISGKPLFGTLISLLYQGKPILGIIDQPILRERWLGGEGLPTTLNGLPVQVRTCPDLSQAILYATSPHMFTGNDALAFNRLREKVKFPLYGCDCYAYALLASGFIDLVVEASLSPYDYCALIPIITGAGGIITDWQGQPLGLQSDGRVIAAADSRIYQQALDQLIL
ncbi:MAG: histidinol-phosphatase [Beggiatoa sp. IS2]|nr:MAG: histidinol-phosphatase [Beggiatoa sp. IS2]